MKTKHIHVRIHSQVLKQSFITGTPLCRQKFPSTSMVSMNIPMLSRRIILYNQCWDVCWFVRLYVYAFWLLYSSNNFPSQTLRALQLPPRSKSKFCAVTSDFSNTPSAIWATYRNCVAKKLKPENGSISSVEWIANLQGSWNVRWNFASGFCSLV